MLADPHTGVVTLRHNVGQAVVDDGLDLDIRILPQELCKFRPEERVDGILGGRYSNGAGGLLAKLTQGRQLRLNLLKPRARGLKQAFARFRRRHAARGARQEANPKPFFEPTDRVTERRLRNTELSRRSGETLLSRHREEGKEVVDVFAEHS